MSNALGTLFGEIANAIREKSGESGTMKPAEFPSKIAQIVAGGGSEKTYLYKTGEFKANAAPYTVNHGLGVIPDLVIVYLPLSTDDTRMIINFSIGFSLAGKTAFGGKSLGITSVLQGGKVVTTIGQGNDYIEETDIPLAGIYSATKDSFSIGGSFFGTNVGLANDQDYNYVVISGLF